MDKIVLKIIGLDCNCVIQVPKNLKIYQLRQLLYKVLYGAAFNIKFSYKDSVLNSEDNIKDLNLTNPNIAILNISIEGDTLIGLYKGYYLCESPWISEDEIISFNDEIDDGIEIKFILRTLENCIEILDSIKIGKCGIMKKELISFFSDKKRNIMCKFNVLKILDPEKLSDYFTVVWFSSIASLIKLKYQFDAKDGFIVYDANFLYNQIRESKNRYISL